MNPIAQIDAANAWKDVKVRFDRLEESKIFRTREFNYIVKQVAALDKAMARLTTRDDPYKRANGINHLCTTLSRDLLAFSNPSMETLYDFKLGGLQRLLSVLVKLVYHPTKPLLDLEDTRMLDTTAKFCRAIVSLYCTFRDWSKGNDSVTKPAFPSDVISTVAALRGLESSFSKALRKKQETEILRDFHVDYAQVRKRIALQRQAQLSRGISLYGETQPRMISDTRSEIKRQQIERLQKFHQDYAKARKRIALENEAALQRAALILRSSSLHVETQDRQSARSSSQSRSLSGRGGQSHGMTQGMFHARSTQEPGMGIVWSQQMDEELVDLLHRSQGVPGKCENRKGGERWDTRLADMEI